MTSGMNTDTSIDVEARGAIEAVVMAATEPVPPALLAQLVELPTTRVEELCEELAAEYEREGRGFQLARVAGGYRFQTHPDAYPYVERFVLRRPDGPAVRTGARNPRDHRVQTADRTGADLRDPRRERRREH